MRDNKQKLEIAALDSVQRNGLKGMSFRTLAADVGIKSSSVHYHFPEKSDLAETLIKRYSDQMSTELANISSQKWGLKKKINAFIGIFESVLDEDKMCLCGMMAAELEELDDNNRKLVQTYFDAIESWLTLLFDENNDKLSTDIGSKTLAKAVLSGLEGALLLDRVNGSKQRLKAQKEIILSMLA